MAYVGGSNIAPRILTHGAGQFRILATSPAGERALVLSGGLEGARTVLGTL
jgi:hypothetical protein